MEDIIAKKLTQRRASIQNIDEDPISSIANLVAKGNSSTLPIIDSRKKVEYNPSKPVVEERKTINISDYDVFTKLRNIDGKDWASILVFLLELHLMDELDRIEKINLPEESRNKILEKIGSFSSKLTRLLNGDLI